MLRKSIGESLIHSSKRPTAKQKHWHKWLRNQACCNCGHLASIHHCAGSSAKHNKVHIGQDWVIPLCYDCHQGDDGIHKSLKAFDTDESRKEIEKQLFVKMIS